MKGDLNKLYSPIIKSHNEAPFHFEKRTSAAFTLKAYNSICGDRFELYLNQKDGKLEPVYFHGFGCAISKASTSVMAKIITGKSISDSIGICHNFLQFIDGKRPVQFALFEEFLAFEGVHDFPERYDCATLAWRELEKFLTHLELK